MKTMFRAGVILMLFLHPGFAMATHWSYEGEGSPEHWGELSPENQLCKLGKNQSPINIDTVLQAHIHPLQAHYQGTPTTILNNGHTIQAGFSADNGNVVTIDSTPFTIEQLHFHAPSENTLHGKHYALEMHMVHKNKAGEVAVVAVMFDVGTANSELTKLWQAMPVQTEESKALTQKIDINKLLPKDLTYYRFSGSLTTPPCSEGVRWLVMKHPLTLSAQQLK